MKSGSNNPSAVATPSSVSYQQPNSQGQLDPEGNAIVQTNETTEDFSEMDPEQQKFFEKSDVKYLQDKSVNISKHLM